MHCTQNEKLNRLSEQSIIVGVDIASETHYAGVFDWRGVELGKVFKFLYPLSLNLAKKC